MYELALTQTRRWHCPDADASRLATALSQRLAEDTACEDG
jgi:hypothetical protein